MNDIEYKQKISEALQRFQNGELPPKTPFTFLMCLGYRSDLDQMDLEPNTPQRCLLRSFDQLDKMNSGIAHKLDEWDSIDLLFN